MNVKTITYQRVKNLGNYESQRLELSAEVDKDEDVNEAISVLKAKVEQALGIVKSPEKPVNEIPF